MVKKFKIKIIPDDEIIFHEKETYHTLSKSYKPKSSRSSLKFTRSYSGKRPKFKYSQSFGSNGQGDLFHNYEPKHNHKVPNIPIKKKTFSQRVALWFINIKIKLKK